MGGQVHLAQFLLSEANMFSLLMCQLPLHQVKGLSIMLKTNLERGISGDETDILKRRNTFGSNTYPQKKGRSFLVLSLIVLILDMFLRTYTRSGFRLFIRVSLTFVFVSRGSFGKPGKT